MSTSFNISLAAHQTALYTTSPTRCQGQADICSSFFEHRLEALIARLAQFDHPAAALDHAEVRGWTPLQRAVLLADEHRCAYLLESDPESEESSTAQEQMGEGASSIGTPEQVLPGAAPRFQSEGLCPALLIATWSVDSFECLRLLFPKASVHDQVQVLDDLRQQGRLEEFLASDTCPPRSRIACILRALKLQKIELAELLYSSLTDDPGPQKTLLREVAIRPYLHPHIPRLLEITPASYIRDAHLHVAIFGLLVGSMELVKECFRHLHEPSCDELGLLAGLAYLIGASLADLHDVVPEEDLAQARCLMAYTSFEHHVTRYLGTLLTLASQRLSGLSLHIFHRAMTQRAALFDKTTIQSGVQTLEALRQKGELKAFLDSGRSLLGTRVAVALRALQAGHLELAQSIYKSLNGLHREYLLAELAIRPPLHSHLDAFLDITASDLPQRLFSHRLIVALFGGLSGTLELTKKYARLTPQARLKGFLAPIVGIACVLGCSLKELHEVISAQEISEALGCMAFSKFVRSLSVYFQGFLRAELISKKLAGLAVCTADAVSEDLDLAHEEVLQLTLLSNRFLVQALEGLEHAQRYRYIQEIQQSLIAMTMEGGDLLPMSAVKASPSSSAERAPALPSPSSSAFFSQEEGAAIQYIWNQANRDPVSVLDAWLIHGVGAIFCTPRGHVFGIVIGRYSLTIADPGTLGQTQTWLFSKPLTAELVLEILEEVHARNSLNSSIDEWKAHLLEKRTALSPEAVVGFIFKQVYGNCCYASLIALLRSTIEAFGITRALQADPAHPIEKVTPVKSVALQAAWDEAIETTFKPIDMLLSLDRRHALERGLDLLQIYHDCGMIDLAPMLADMVVEVGYSGDQALLNFLQELIEDRQWPFDLDRSLFSPLPTFPARRYPLLNTLQALAPRAFLQLPPNKQAALVSCVFHCHRMNTLIVSCIDLLEHPETFRSRKWAHQFVSYAQASEDDTYVLDKIECLLQEFGNAFFDEQLDTIFHVVLHPYTPAVDHMLSLLLGRGSPHLRRANQEMISFMLKMLGKKDCLKYVKLITKLAEQYSDDQKILLLCILIRENHQDTGVYRALLKQGPPDLEARAQALIASAASTSAEGSDSLTEIRP